MIPKDCKRLAEVDFPIAAVSKHAAREKSIRHGHPSTLHLWWARRPLASSRAVLLTLLLPDPCDPLCPTEFKTEARELLPQLTGQPGPTNEDLRKALLRFIADFANWDHSAHPTFLEVGRGLVRAAHGEEAPLVVDPFAGGGSIPLEALRLGCEAFGSDLNPVACVVLRLMLEEIPRHGPELAAELRDAGAEIKQDVDRQLAEFYPEGPDGARPIAYLWARTVRCESPRCGAEIPLIRSLWLSKKTNRRRALRHRIVRAKGKPPRIEFEIFEPRREEDVSEGTVSHAKATCPACASVLPPDRVRAQLVAQGGGTDVVLDKKGRRLSGARMIAVVALRAGDTGRQYRAAVDSDYIAVRKAQSYLASLHSRWEEAQTGAPCPVPDEPVIQSRVAKNSPFRFHLYGCNTFGSLCNARQQVALATLAQTLREKSASKTLHELLALVLNKVASRSSSLSTWRYQADQEKVEHMFVRQALSLEWDFAEAVPISRSTGSFEDSLDTVALGVEMLGNLRLRPGQALQADAAHSPLTDEVAAVWFTDPPYYDAVPYSDLSDYFFVWLKRALPNQNILSRAFDEFGLTPKDNEIRMDEARAVNGSPKDGAFFERGIAEAFADGRRVLSPDGIGCVVFAHKTTEGWEALLSAMIGSGLTVTASWPIATEMATRLRARKSAALATSIHLVSRPRPTDAEIGDWATVLRELPRRVSEWMIRLEAEGVHGADLVFACIGPALEIFSRYTSVETAEGRKVPLADYLEKVWEVVGRAALEQVLGTAEARARNGGLGALEEDSRLTALFLWTLNAGNTATSDDVASDPDDEEADEDEDGASSKKAKGLTLIYDIVRRFAQPLGIHLEAWEGRIIETKKGVVRLLPVVERARQLFGEAGAEALASSIEKSPAKAAQLELFPDSETKVAKIKPKGRKKAAAAGGSAAYTGQVTTLDRVHAAMLFQRQGQTNALRSLLAAEIERGPDFVRLANALSALYPRDSDEKRLLDAMLLALPRR
jgi:adenine-specific DNA methylase